MAGCHPGPSVGLVACMAIDDNRFQPVSVIEMMKNGCRLRWSIGVLAWGLGGFGGGFWAPGMAWHVVGMPRLFASACTGQNRGPVACYQASGVDRYRADVPTCRRADVLQLQREPHPAPYI